MKERQRGPRGEISTRVIDKHRVRIIQAHEERLQAEDDLLAAKKRQAKMIDAAITAGVATQDIADWLGVTRQNVWRYVNVYIDQS